MPELPEVETVKETLKPIIIGNKITKIDVLRPSIIEGDINKFVSGLINETFLDITRYGKYLFLHLTNDKVIISHLRMEGKYFEYLEEENNSKFARVVFHLSNAHKVCYDDSRCFGRLKLSSEATYLKEKEIAKLGPEPFDADYIKIYNAHKHSKEAIKKTLLDQTVMCGIGNIYCDEILFISHLNPNTETNLITKQKWREIIENSRKILLEAIKDGGSTVKSYHPGKDISGNFQSRLLAYGKENEPCPNCGHKMRFIKVGGRGTTFCPNCQNKLASKITIAITGQVASGKSTVAAIFKKNNIPTISADEVVHNLYKDKNVVNKIAKMFSLNMEDKMDLALLRTYLKNNPKDIKKINGLIHPLVIKEIKNFVNNIKSGLVVAEIPLLYESHMDREFDVIIGVEIFKKEQIKRLTSRENSNSKELLEINKNSAFNKHKDTVTYLINNDNSLINLEKQVNKIICIEKSHLN